MLEIEINGRLGNQMFQYATLRAFQEKGYDSKINLCFRNIESRNNKEAGWENSLQYFHVKDFETMETIHPSFLQKAILKIYRKIWSHNNRTRLEEHNFEIRWIRLLNFFGIYWLTQGYYDFRKSSARNKLFFGYFESVKYFNDIKEQLWEEFTPKEERLEKNQLLYQEIENTESVCVTIRRGDFVENLQVKNGALVCTERYFERAIKKMKEEVPNAKFFIFSDDVKWCRENMEFPAGTMFEDGTDPIWEKLRLMYCCKHFIISNSTFSWWAQYLSRNPDKIVMAPNRWRNYEAKLDIYEENWQLIEVEPDEKK